MKQFEIRDHGFFWKLFSSDLSGFRLFFVSIEIFFVSIGFLQIPLPVDLKIVFVETRRSSVIRECQNKTKVQAK